MRLGDDKLESIVHGLYGDADRLDQRAAALEARLDPAADQTAWATLHELNQAARIVRAAAKWLDGARKEML